MQSIALRPTNTARSSVWSAVVLEVDQIRLRDKEVVSTFDDGPWPANAPAVLKVLIDECLKATIKRHIS